MYTSVAAVRAYEPATLTSSMASDDQITAAIIEADAEIDAHLAGKYALPLSATPAIISVISRELTAVSLLVSIYSQNIPNNSEWVDSRLKRIEKKLGMLSNGGLTLVGSDGVPLSAPTLRVASNTEQYSPIFDTRAPEYEEIDPDRVTADGSRT